MTNDKAPLNEPRAYRRLRQTLYLASVVETLRYDQTYYLLFKYDGKAGIARVAVNDTGSPDPDDPYVLQYRLGDILDIHEEWQRFRELLRTARLFGVIQDGPYQDPEKRYWQAVSYVVQSRRPSISAVQRHLKSSFKEAAGYLERMEREGVVSEILHNGTRLVLWPATH